MVDAVRRTVRRAVVLVAALVVAAGLAAAPAGAAADPGLRFLPIPPTRTFDTRTTGNGPVRGKGTLTVTFRPGALPDNVKAVVFNLTAINTTNLGTFVTAWSGQGTRPFTSNVNLAPNETRAAMVTVPIGATSTPEPGTRTIGFYNNTGAVDMTVDTAGYYVAPPAESGEPPSSGYQPITPTRVLDTRSGAPLGPGATTTADLSGAVPTGTSAVVLNLTATEPTAYTFATVWPDGTRMPGASALNVNPGETTPNLVTVALGSNRRLALYNKLGNTHLIADVVGYYAPTAPNTFYPSDPVRLVDTRDGSGATKLRGALGPGAAVTVPSVQSDPTTRARTKAFALSITGVGPTGNTYLTAWASGTRPTASNLNLVPGQVASNAAHVGLTDGAFQLYNNAGRTDVVVDAFGAFATPASS